MTTNAAISGTSRRWKTHIIWSQLLCHKHTHKNEMFMKILKESESFFYLYEVKVFTLTSLFIKEAVGGIFFSFILACCIAPLVIYQSSYYLLLSQHCWFSHLTFYLFQFLSFFHALSECCGDFFSRGGWADMNLWTSVHNTVGRSRPKRLRQGWVHVNRPWCWSVCLVHQI